MEPFEKDEFSRDAEQDQPAAPEVPSFLDSQEPVTEAPLPEQRAEPEAPAKTVYYGVGAGRKESPYANSPYETPSRPQPEYSYHPQTQPPVKQKKPKKAKKSGLGRTVASVALVAAMVAGGCGITALAVNEYWEERTENTVSQLTKRIDDLQKQIEKGTASGGIAAALPADGSTLTPRQLYASSVNSVVAISTTIQSTSFYGTTEGTSSGSGFILTEDGYVISNYHVVEGATSIRVTTHDGTEYPASLVGYDSSNDLAVLKVEATGLSAAALGSSQDLVIGDMVVAIGNPLGELASTQTVGYVSGIDREVSTGGLTTISMIQTDAAINPGNSGGPLFNMQGQVIGITTAKYSGTTGSGASIEGIGFAIPIDDVAPLITDLIDHGYVTGAYMGVTVKNTDEESAALFGLPTGAYIDSVESGGAADRAGIQPKDIVIGLGEYEVSNVTDLTRALRNFRAGDTTTVKVLRGGRELTLEITLDERPQDTTVSGSTVPQPDGEMPSSGDFNDLYEYFRRYFGG